MKRTVFSRVVVTLWLVVIAVILLSSPVPLYAQEDGGEAVSHDDQQQNADADAEAIRVAEAEAARKKAELEAAQRAAAEEEERVRRAAEEVKKQAEEERLRREAAERAEAERVAAEDAAKAEEERLAAEMASLEAKAKGALSKIKGKISSAADLVVVKSKSLIEKVTSMTGPQKKKAAAVVAGVGFGTVAFVAFTGGSSPPPVKGRK